MSGIEALGFHLTPKAKTASCDTHGDFVSQCVFRDVWSRCPVCADEKEAAEALENEVKKRERARGAWERKIGDAGIPERFRDRTLESFVADSSDKQKALDFSKKYAETFDEVLASGRSAIFVGRPGTGKTHLAVGIGLHIMDEGRSVLFTTVMRAIRRVKDTWSRDSKESETSAIASLAFPDLLILDEVGVQFGSDAEKLILFDVLNERYEKRRPTLLLSNLSAADVKPFLGERIFDRLREDGGQVIGFAWASHRGSK